MAANTGNISAARMEELFGINRDFITSSFRALDGQPLTPEVYEKLLKVWSTKDNSAQKMPDELRSIWLAYWIDGCTIAASTKAVVMCEPDGGGQKEAHRIYWLTENWKDIYKQLVAEWPHFHCSESYFQSIRPAYVKDPNPDASVCTLCQQTDDLVSAYKREILAVHRQDLPQPLPPTDQERCKTTYLHKNPQHIICSVCGPSNILFEAVEDSPFPNTFKIRACVKTTGAYLRLMCCDDAFCKDHSEKSFQCTCIEGTCSSCFWKKIQYCDKAKNSTHVFTYDMLTAEKKQSASLDESGKSKTKTTKVYLTRDTKSTFSALADKVKKMMPLALAHKKRKELMYEWQYKRLPALLQKGKWNVTVFCFLSQYVLYYFEKSRVLMSYFLMK